MAFPVYSHVFFSVEGLTGEEHVTIPDGFIGVVRCIDAYANVNFDVVDLFVKDVGSGATFWSVRYELLEQGPRQWRGRQVFIPESILQIDNIGAHGVDVRVSGYLLKENPA